jgi:hypothetical protein
MIGLVMSKVTGQSWHELARERVWSKIGAESEANIWLDTEGQGAAAGGMSSTLRDAARFAELVRNGGKIGQTQVVPAAAIAAIRAPAGNAGAAAVGNVALLKVRPGMSYKSYWYRVNDGKGSLEALGIFGQHIYVNPKDGITIVQLGSFTGPGPNPKNWSAAEQAIIAALAERGVSEARRHTPHSGLLPAPLPFRCGERAERRARGLPRHLSGSDAAG